MRITPRILMGIVGGVSVFLGSVMEVHGILRRHDMPTEDYQALGLLPETQSITRLTLGFGDDPFTGSVVTGSGVHIGGGYILTAAHLFHAGGDSLSYLTVRTRDDQLFGVALDSQVRIHSGYDPLDYAGTKGYDIALFRLRDWEFLVGEGSAQPFEAATVWVGDALTGGELVVGGFGRRGTGLEPGVAGSAYLSAKNVLDSSSDDGRLGHFDFDRADAPIDNLGSSVPLDLEGMVNPGDSGGGWFALDAGNLVLSHITSGILGNLDGVADGGYGDIATGVRVASHWDWIYSSAREMEALYGKEPEFRTLGGEPPQVSGLGGQALSDTSVRLTWQPAARAVSYNIYRDGTLVATTLGTAFDDTGLQEETSYSYEVGAANTAGDGPRSTALTVSTMAFVDANPRALLVRSPSAAMPHDGATFLFTGRAGSGLTGDLSWSNTSTGETSSFPLARDWFVSVPTAPGTNRVVFTGRYVVASTNTATDSADDAVYSGGWINGSSGGSGFAPWVFGTSGVVDISRSLVAPAPGLPEQPTFGLWSGRTGTATARRDLAVPLVAAGSKFGCTFKNRYIRTGGQVGFELVDAAGQPRLAFYRVGGESRYRVSDAVTARDTGINLSRDEFPVEFVLASSNAYTLKIGTNEVTGVLAPGGNITGFNAFSRTANPSRSDVFVEAFDYPVDADLSAQTGGTGFGGAWEGGDSLMVSGSGAQPKWLRVGGIDSVRSLPAALTTGTNPLYFSFVFRSSDYASSAFSGFSLVSTNGVEEMFFGIPWMKGALGFDAHGDGGTDNIMVANTNLVAGQPYLVTYGLLPSATAGRVDVKMWMTTNTAIDPFLLVRSQPVASLVGSRTNFSFTQVAVGGDAAGFVSGANLEIASVRCWNNLETTDYELFVNNLSAVSVTETTDTVSVTAPDVVGVGDADADGIVDWWEVLHFGSIEACQPGSDSDNDGFNNLQEWKLGTLPLDASSRFEVTSVQWGGGADMQYVYMTWPSVPGKSYRLMGSASLSVPDWTHLAVHTALADISNMMHVVPQGSKQMFFRVELVEEAEPMMARVVTGNGSAAMLPTAAIEDSDAASSLPNPVSAQPVAATATGANDKLAAVEVLNGDRPAPTAVTGAPMSSWADADPVLGNRPVELSISPTTRVAQNPVVDTEVAANLDTAVEREGAAATRTDETPDEWIVGSVPEVASVTPDNGVSAALPVRQPDAVAPPEVTVDGVSASADESPVVGRSAENTVPAQTGSSWFDLPQWWEFFVSWLAKLFAAPSAFTEVKSNASL